MNDNTDISVRGSPESASDPTQIRAITDYIADGIVTIDEGGVILTFNPAAERMFGYLAADAIGQSVNVLMPGPYADEHDQYLEK